MQPRIVPVIDLKDGRVVHAVAGRRHDYQPIRSSICDDASPHSVAEAFYARGAREVYVADLDALQLGRPQWSALQVVVDVGLSVYLDVGIRDSAQARQACEFARRAGRGRNVRTVLALESLVDPESLTTIVTELERDTCTFSLDLMHGKLNMKVDAWSRFTPLGLLSELIERWGFSSWIVLDLAHVGTGEGPKRSVVQLCQRIRQQHPQLELLSGGGVRDLADVARFQAAGCSGVLVGTAIHQGAMAIARED